MMQRDATLGFLRDFRSMLNDYGHGPHCGRRSVEPAVCPSRASAFTRRVSDLLHAAYTLKLAKEPITPHVIIMAYEEMFATAVRRLYLLELSRTTMRAAACRAIPQA